MALSPLTISVSSGVQGRGFKSAVSGFAAGNVVEVMPGSSWGFGYSNGFLTHNGLPADTNLAILRERDPVTGENLTTNLIVTAASAYAVAQKASALDATYRSYRIAPITQVDGSQIWNVFTEGTLGATLNTPINGTTAPPVNTDLPAITGTAQEGQTLSVSSGTWTNSPTSYTYQWYADAAAISGAINPTRILTSAEIGKIITCRVTATNAGGSATASSAGTSAVIAASIPVPVNTVAPAVTGTATVGSTLTTTDGTWTNSPTSFAYQWRQDGVNISGATASTYVVLSGDSGHTITCRVTATNGGGSGFAVSNGVAIAASGLTYVQAANVTNLWDPASIGVADGTSLSTLIDSIGGVAGTTPSGQPTYKTSVLNGKPGIRFAGNQWFDLGRQTEFLNTLAGDHTLMFVCTNLVAGANQLAAIFGDGSVASGRWMVINTTKIGMYNGNYINNPLATTDLYVIFYSARRSGTSRVLAGCNTTSFFPSDIVVNSGTNPFTMGTGRADTTANGNAYSTRCDFLWGACWNTNLSFTDIVRQTRLIFNYFGKPMPWAGVTKYILDDGDSITKGLNAQADTCYPFLSAADLGRKFGEWSQTGRPSATITMNLNDLAFQFTGLSGADALGIPVVWTYMEYANVRGSSTASNLASIASYASTLKGLLPTCTLVSMTSTALGGTGGVNGDQTADGGLGTNISAQGTRRIAFGDSLLASPPTGVDLVIPLHQDAAVGQVGANPYTPNAGNLDFGSDVTHPLGTAGQSASHGHARIAALHSAAIGPLL